jgi:hypothetical protein
MSEKIDRIAPFLLTLKSLKPKQRRSLLETCTREQLKAFEEIAVNLVKNTQGLTPEQLKICKRYRRPLKLLAEGKKSARAKKGVLLQKGGFFAALLPILASVVGGIIGSRA